MRASRFASLLHVSEKKPQAVEVRDGKSTGQRRLEAAVERSALSLRHGRVVPVDGASWLPSAVRVRAVHAQPNGARTGHQQPFSATVDNDGLRSCAPCCALGLETTRPAAANGFMAKYGQLLQSPVNKGPAVAPSKHRCRSAKIN
ncbi:hypothetical protein ACSS6W_003928 [Trichoderma asperelloides]